MRSVWNPRVFFIIDYFPPTLQYSNSLLCCSNGATKPPFNCLPPKSPSPPPPKASLGLNFPHNLLQIKPVLLIRTSELCAYELYLSLWGNLRSTALELGVKTVAHFSQSDIPALKLTWCCMKALVSGLLSLPLPAQNLHSTNEVR